MEKVVMLIWQFRDDPSVVQFMAQFVAKVRCFDLFSWKSQLFLYQRAVHITIYYLYTYSHSHYSSFRHSQFAGSRDVFAGIEFYLPQLAHMIVHLEVEWDDAILERFALVIAQQSLHFALQLNWILQGAIEDYAPELTSGEVNPQYNPLYYSRCLKLLQNIERVVVYGRPRSLELQRLFDEGKITKREYEILELHDRRFNALQIQERTHRSKILYDGELLYKRKVRTSCWKPKPWKVRYFCIQNGFFHCFNKKGGTLVRSMPLEGAQIQSVTSGKYQNMFSVENRGFLFIIRATSPDEKERWMRELHQGSQVLVEELDDEDVLQTLSLSQRARYDFFLNERDFCRHVCGLAENLRLHPRDDRKGLAPGMQAELNIPPLVYIPLCNSTDIWRRVHKALPNYIKVFNTNERCPIIMHFISKRGEAVVGKHPGLKNVNIDVAEYLHLTFDIMKDAMEPIAEERDVEAIEVPSKLPDPATPTNGGAPEHQEDELQESTHASLWHEANRVESDETRDPSDRGNKQVRAFLRDNLVGMPKKLARHIHIRRRLSHLDQQIGSVMENIPILGDSKRIVDQEDDESVVSVEPTSAVKLRDSILVKQPSDIDEESIQRATEVISGGVRWTEKTYKMLEENVDTDDEGVCEITSLMAKSNDDLRQEVFVMQMIHYYKSVFAKAQLPLWLKTYRILSMSKDTGLIEVLTDASSIDGLKKSERFPKEGGLRTYFEQCYGDPEGPSFKAAQRNFMQSLAAYSLVSYLLGLKDRHNGNIMINNMGYLIFIDFGFAMGMAPGHEFSFERAPFKLTKEYVEVMGGLDSDCFKEFRQLFVQGFMEARKNSLIALGLVEIMMYKSKYPCFTGSRYGNGISLKRFEQRLMLHVPENQVEKRANKLIDKSYNHFGTNFYDKFQKWSNDYEI
jgi:phosphatidylinositol 4-kinase